MTSDHTQQVRFGFSRPRRAACVYMSVMSSVGIVVAAVVWAGAAPSIGKASDGPSTMLGASILLVLFLRLQGSYAAADAAGIRARALRPRFIPASEVADVIVIEVQHMAWYRTPIAPYVVRGTGESQKFVKLAALERLANPTSQALLEEQARQLLAAVRPSAEVPPAVHDA